jgi:hypothetical protein
MTISTWVKPGTQSGDNAIVGKYNGGVVGEYILGMNASLYVYAHREVSPYSMFSTGPISVNQWHHIVYTYNGTHVLIYIDGTFNKATAYGSVGGDSVTPVYIGARKTSSSPSSFFNGTIDQVRFYGYSLDANQIDQLYKEGLYGYESTITEAETTVGENWSVTVTPNDGKLDGTPSSSGNLTIRDSLPTITQIVVDDYETADPRIDNITLNGASTRTVMCNGTATDTDGFADKVAVNATFYDTAVAYNAADNNNTHYTNSSCYKYGGVSNSVNFNCTFNVYYYANSTSWRCNATAYDNAGQNATATDDNYIDELIAIDSSTAYVNFGTVSAGTTSAEKTFTAINVCNVRLDLSMNGTDFNCPINPDITVGMLKYNCTTAGQNFDTQMANLTTVATITYCTAFDLAKKILTDTSNSTKDNYWKLFVPIGTVGAQNCNSTVRVAATKG